MNLAFNIIMSVAKDFLLSFYLISYERDASTSKAVKRQKLTFVEWFGFVATVV